MSISIRRALISVWNKNGVVEFGQELSSNGVEIYSTGGTGKALKTGGIDVIPLETLTGFEQLIGGRVKTLHPKVFAGILARRDLDEHLKSLDDQSIPIFDMIVVNLYPFMETLKKTDIEMERLEMIDIGGVALLRAAAKNYPSVVVVSEPADYGEIIAELKEHNEITMETSRKLAAKAFRHTCFYDSVIAGTLSTEPFPEKYPVSLQLERELRYGENPHQKAALYSDPLSETGVVQAEQLWGKKLSYNNFLDLDAVYNAIMEFSNETACAIVKHLSPCGIARGDSLLEAYEGALSGDPMSAFGGIAGFTRKIDLPTAEKISKHFFECILAPDYNDDALELLKKKKNLRLMKLKLHRSDKEQLQFRGISGGMLVQSVDPPEHKPEKWEVVSKRKPTPEEDKALRFVWRAIRSIKSNSVIIGGEDIVYGIGGGLPSRVDAAKLSITKAEDKIDGAVAASDAFFPFPDGVEVLAEAGVKAVVQPGGSIRDQKVTDRADELGLVMIHTCTRHFRH